LVSFPPPATLLLKCDLAAPIAAPAWPVGVRPVAFEVADAKAIHALMQRAYANGFGSVTADWLDWWEALRADSEFDRDLCFVAKAEGGEVVGSCLCWTSSFVKDLVVAPEWQHHGIGEALLLSALTALKARGATEIRLKVLAANAAARRLYARLGFAI